MTTEQPRDEPVLIRAPWTPEQVDALNAFQKSGGMHPFTCGVDRHGDAKTLIATEYGWRCPDDECDYRQDWAHAFMADPEAWPKPGWIARLSTPDDDRSQITETVRGGRRLGPAPDGDGQAVSLRGPDGRGVATGANPRPEDTPAIPCNFAFARHPHAAHHWQPHSGLLPVRCPGFEAAVTASLAPKAPQSGDAAPTLLARVLADQGVSQADLARRTRLSTKHVNQLCQGVAHISVDVAIRLEFVLGIDAAEWMRADTAGQIAQHRDAAVLALVRPELEQLRETRAAVDTADLRERIAALFRTAPGEDRLGDEVPGYIAEAVLRTLANPPAGGQETGAGQAGETR